MNLNCKDRESFIGKWNKKGYPKFLPYDACKKADREAMTESDNRRFCYGLIDLQYDEICDACIECPYYFDNYEEAENG